MQQDAAAAEQALGKALAAANAWVTSSPEHVHALAAVARASVSLAANAMARGDLPGASACLAEADPVVAMLAKLEPLHDRSVEARAAVAIRRTLVLRAQQLTVESRATMATLLAELERWHHSTGERPGVPTSLVADSHRLAAACAPDAGAELAADAHLAAAERWETQAKLRTTPPR